MIRRDIEPQLGCLAALTALTALGAVTLGAVITTACKAAAAHLMGV